MATRGSEEGRQRGGEASLHTEKVSAAELQLYLKGIDYPADKKTLINTCRSNSCPENVMSFINKLPEKQYNSPVEVEQEFSRVK